MQASETFNDFLGLQSENTLNLTELVCVQTNQAPLRFALISTLTKVMCGRAACTLAPQDLQRKFAYTRKRTDQPKEEGPSPSSKDDGCQGDGQEPTFHDKGCKYKQSYNTTPKQYL